MEATFSADLIVSVWVKVSDPDKVADFSQLLDTVEYYFPYDGDEKFEQISSTQQAYWEEFEVTIKTVYDDGKATAIGDLSEEEADDLRDELEEQIRDKFTYNSDDFKRKVDSIDIEEIS
jgi:hypothetical protein